MKNLHYANIAGTSDVQPSWQEVATAAGLDPKRLTCVTWCEIGRHVPKNAVAFFKVRSGDPANYLVPTTNYLAPTVGGR